MRKYIILAMALVASVAGQAAKTNNKFLQADIIGFSGDVVTSYSTQADGKQTAPYDLIKGSKDFKAYLHADGSIPRDKNTCIYYAMDLALDRVEYVRKHITKNDPNTKYYIFLLTDGLDNNSAQVAKNNHKHLIPVSAERYPAYLQERTKEVMSNRKNVFEIYPMLFEGEDIKTMRQSNRDFDEYLSRKLGCLGYTSTSDEPMSLIHADDYGKILKELRQKFLMSSYEFQVPKSYVGKRVRMTLYRKADGEKHATTVGTIEGELVNHLGKFKLRDIRTNGISILDMNRDYPHDRKTCLISPTGVNSKDSNIRFAIERVLDGDKAFMVDAAKVKQEVEDDGMWILNTEYSEVAEVNVDTYFILLVDGSTSLDGKNGKGQGFAQEKKTVEAIIDMIRL